MLASQPCRPLPDSHSQAGQISEDTTIEMNWCYGLAATGGGRIGINQNLAFTSGLVANVVDNSGSCWSG